jgi:hypothetical protein
MCKPSPCWGLGLPTNVGARLPVVRRCHWRANLETDRHITFVPHAGRRCAGQHLLPKRPLGHAIAFRTIWTRGSGGVASGVVFIGGSAAYHPLLPTLTTDSAGWQREGDKRNRRQCGLPDSSLFWPAQLAWSHRVGLLAHAAARRGRRTPLARPGAGF